MEPFNNKNVGYTTCTTRMEPYEAYQKYHHDMWEDCKATAKNTQRHCYSHEEIKSYIDNWELDRCICMLEELRKLRNFSPMRLYYFKMLLRKRIKIHRG